MYEMKKRAREAGNPGLSILKKDLATEMKTRRGSHAYSYAMKNLIAEGKLREVKLDKSVGVALPNNTLLGKFSSVQINPSSRVSCLTQIFP